MRLQPEVAGQLRVEILAVGLGEVVDLAGREPVDSRPRILAVARTDSARCLREARMGWRVVLACYQPEGEVVPAMVELAARAESLAQEHIGSMVEVLYTATVPEEL